MPWARRPEVRFRYFYNSTLNLGTRWAWSASFSGHFPPHKHPPVLIEKPTDGVPEPVGRSRRDEGYLSSVESLTKISRLAKSRPSYYSDWAIPGLSYNCLGDNAAQIDVLSQKLCSKLSSARIIVTDVPDITRNAIPSIITTIHTAKFRYKKHWANLITHVSVVFTPYTPENENSVNFNLNIKSIGLNVREEN